MALLVMLLDGPTSNLHSTRTTLLALCCKRNGSCMGLTPWIHDGERVILFDNSWEELDRMLELCNASLVWPRLQHVLNSTIVIFDYHPSHLVVRKLDELLCHSPALAL